MTSVLHILFDGTGDDLARRVMEVHEKDPSLDMKVVDMKDGSTDVDELVDMIFSSDKVFSWHKR